MPNSSEDENRCRKGSEVPDPEPSEASVRSEGVRRQEAPASLESCLPPRSRHGSAPPQLRGVHTSSALGSPAATDSEAEKQACNWNITLPGGAEQRAQVQGDNGGKSPGNS